MYIYYIRIMSEKRLQEYVNSFSLFSAAIVSIQKKEKKPQPKNLFKPFQNPSQRAVPALTVSAEKYWDHVSGSDSYKFYVKTDKLELTNFAFNTKEIFHDNGVRSFLPKE